MLYNTFFKGDIMTDVSVTYVKHHVNEPSLDVTVYNAVAIKAVGQTQEIYIGDIKYLELLTTLGTETGAASIRFHVEVMNVLPTTHTVIKTYDGSERTSAGSEVLTIDNTGTGDYIRVTWTTAGTLSNDHWFDACYIRLLGK